MKKNTIHKLIVVLFLFVFSSTKPVIATVIQASNEHYVKAVANNNDYVLPNGMHLSELLNVNEPSFRNTGQPFENAYTFGGTGVTQVSKVVVDKFGNQYITGGFSGTIEYNEKMYTSTSGYDFFLAKLDASGSVLWVSTAAGSSTLSNELSLEGGFSMAIDDDDQIYVGGSFVKYLSFKDAEGEDSFIINYDVDGDWYFFSFMGSGEQVVASAIGSSKNGDIYVSGYFSDKASLVGSYIVLEALGNTDGFLAKYDPNGYAIWGKNFGFETASADRLIVDDDENIIVLGTYRDKIIFGAEKGKQDPIILTTESESNLFMAKFDSSGTILWAKNIEGSGAESKDLIFNETTMPYVTSPLDMVSSKYNGGEIILTGDFDGTLSIDDIQLVADSGNRKVFTAVMDNPVATPIEDNNAAQVSEFKLYQNYPNPFNPSSTIRFDLANSEFVSLSIYSILGQKVATLVNENLAAGSHEFMWDASELASGSYLYKISTGSFNQTKMMTLVK